MCISNADMCHLHVHSHYSIADALPTPDELTKQARRMGFGAVALTDHGNMNGSIALIKGALSPEDDLPEIKPIIGMEAYTCKSRKVHMQEEFQSYSYTLTDKNGLAYTKTVERKSKRPEHPHLTLLAANETGYRNLMNLQSLANEEGFYYSPRIDRELLEQHSEGLIILSGCYGSEISQSILRGNIEHATETAAYFRDLVGERFFMELHNHGMPEQQQILGPTQVAIAKELGIRCVAANDTHYLEATDAFYHDVFLDLREAVFAKGSAEDVSSGKKEAYKSRQFWLKSAEEMSRVMPMKAIMNTRLVAEMCDGAYIKRITNSRHLLPHVVIPTTNAAFNQFKERNFPYHAANEAYLAFIAFNGLKELQLDQKPGYRTRLKYEWTTICNMGVVDYFLIQREMVEFCRAQGILYGIRGSGVGSLLNHCIGICPVDPIDGNLLFERFLNPGRGTQYKIDLSCLPVKDWKAIEEKGDAKTASARLAQVATEMEARFPEAGPAIHREVWVLENQGLAGYLCDIADRGITAPDNECNLWTAYALGITEKLPEGGMIVSKVATLPDVDSDIEKARREEVIEWAKQRVGPDNFARISTQNTYKARAAVQGVLKVDPEFCREHGEHVHIAAQRISKTIPERAMPPMTIDEAIELTQDETDPEKSFAYWANRYLKQIERAKHIMDRASSVGVHAAGVIMSSEPVRNHAPLVRTKDGELATGYDMNNVDGTGLVKYDYLGLSTLGMISYCLRLIERNYGKDHVPDLERIAREKNDPKVFRLYADGKTATVFQFASPGMQKSLKEVRVDTFEDLVAVVALFRPGPLKYIPEYAKGKHSLGLVRFADPVLEKHLGVTFGIMVYQEQAMNLAYDMASMTWTEIDKLRKAISKKSGKDFEESCKKFRNGSLKNEFSETTVDNTLKLMAAFGSYAFNRSHAYAYARLSYQTAYLRQYFPAEWLASYLQVEEKDTKRALALHDAESAHIIIRRPDVNESGIDTTVNNKGEILLPLNSLKGVATMVESILTIDRPFADLRDFCYRARLNKSTVRALAEGGALNCFNEVRSMQGGATTVMERYEEMVSDRDRADKAAEKAAKQKYRVDSPLDTPSTGGVTRPTSAVRAPSTAKTRKPVRLSDPFGGGWHADDLKK